MDRRSYLAGLGGTLGTASLAGVAGVTGLAGCLEAPTARGSTRVVTNPRRRHPARAGELELPVPREELVRGAARDAIPAITEPAFGPDWAGLSMSIPGEFDTIEIEPRLSPDDRIIGVANDAAARAYPLRVFNWHEVVNDRFPTADGGTEPLLVTYCPLCGSGVTAERRLGGAVPTFGVSGMLWRADLVMYDDAEESLWSQVYGMAIRGPRTGERLTLHPSSLTTLGEWRAAHPDTEVLLPSPMSKTVLGPVARNYTMDPYGGYEDTETIGVTDPDLGDDRLHPKTVVVGVRSGDSVVAYPLPTVRKRGVVNDWVGDRPVVVALDAGRSLAAYERVVDGSVVRFSRAGQGTMRAAGSRWRIATGTAIDGPHAGATLRRANDQSPMFWFAWAEFNPDTAVYGQG